VLWFIAALVLPWFAAYQLAARCDGRERGVAAFFFRASLAVGLGTGLSSCTCFLWLLLVGPPGKTYFALDLIGFAAAAYVLMRSRVGQGRENTGGASRTGQPSGGAPGDATPNAATAAPPESRLARPTLLPLAVVYCLAMLLAVLGMAATYWTQPHGDWDAWNIWNLRARFLFRAGDDWRQAFAPVFPHTDYPLLLPCSNARCWSYLGSDPTWVPWLTGTLFTLAAVGLLTSGVCRLRGRSHGLLAGLVLLGTVAFLARGASQYADVPLAMFFLAGVLLPVLYDASDRPWPGLLLLAGTCAGLAAWTKNEGLLFVLALLAVRGLLAVRRRTAKSLGQWALVVLGCAPPLVLVAIQKTCLESHNDVMSGQNWQAACARLTDWPRYGEIARALAGYMYQAGKAWLFVLPLCFLLLGPAKSGCRTPGRGTALGCFALMLAGYCLVYLISPLDLNWQLRTSADRLLVQLWPMLVLVTFLYLRTPEATGQ
jgi:hypothetical protein